MAVSIANFVLIYFPYFILSLHGSQGFADPLPITEVIFVLFFSLLVIVTWMKLRYLFFLQCKSSHVPTLSV